MPSAKTMTGSPSAAMFGFFHDQARLDVFDVTAGSRSEGIVAASGEGKASQANRCSRLPVPSGPSQNVVMRQEFPFPDPLAPPVQGQGKWGRTARGGGWPLAGRRREHRPLARLSHSFAGGKPGGRPGTVSG